MTAISVPLPVGVGFCLEGQHDVPLDPRGRCPEHKTLCIWRSDRPRPPVVTETLVRLQEAARIDPESKKGVRPSSTPDRRLTTVAAEQREDMGRAVPRPTSALVPARRVAVERSGPRAGFSITDRQDETPFRH